MARIVPEGDNEIYATIRPIANDTLPTNAQELKQLNERLDTVRREISNIGHRTQMERLARSISQRN
jgi:hypothetical protein